ncbi:MAG TPA: hypothetical protein VG269_23105 [Tepidisphaeraceae bacterium]|jgi:hypothetical protein|nr:hypothetical protein [Tepidisphaeraceae bacterium]
MGFTKSTKGHECNDEKTKSIASPGSDVRRVILRANRVLPGKPAPDGRRDPRWQAIIHVGEFIESQPDAVWEFTLRWGKHPQADLRSAIATCLLEHLLEHHYQLIFPRVAAAAKSSRRFADTLSGIIYFGQAKETKNRTAIERLHRASNSQRKRNRTS